MIVKRLASALDNLQKIIATKGLSEVIRNPPATGGHYSMLTSISSAVL